MVKTRVSTRFKTAVGGKSHNKSEDLEQLTEKYNVFNKNLKGFIAILKQHYAAMEALTKSRIEMANHIALLSNESPLSDHVSAMPAAGAPPDSIYSYMATHRAMATKNKLYSGRFAKFVIEYTIQWQEVVSKRIDKTLKEAEKSRVEADHYQSKVESLRQSANEKLAKGKQIDQKSAEKLSRNEEKLVKIKEENRKGSKDACLLVEELTDRAWRDLHPLLVKVMQFDMTISSEEAKAMANLKAVVNELKKIAAAHGVSEDARLKEIESLAPADLSTKGETDSVEVESDTGRLSFAGGANIGINRGGDMHFPPGTTAPRASGGFPVPIKSSDGSFQGHQFPASGSNSPPNRMSTMDMVAISAAAAPPPSMDQLEAAFGNSQSSLSLDSEISAPPAAAPPPPPAADTNAFGAAPTPDTNPFGSAATPMVAPSMTPIDTNPFGSASTNTTPSMYGAAPPTNPFGQAPAPAPSTNPFGGAPNPAAPSNDPFGDTRSYPAAAASPYTTTPPMLPPQQAPYGGQQLSMYGNNGVGTTSAGNHSNYQQQQQGYGQQRGASSNPFA